MVDIQYLTTTMSRQLMTLTTLSAVATTGIWYIFCLIMI